MEGPMLTAEERMELEVLRKHGAGIRELARVTRWSRNTVRRYLREGAAAAVRKAAPKRAEKLDRFKAYIVDRVKAAAPDRIPAVVLFREIKARLRWRRDAGEAVRARARVGAPTPPPAVRFETEPGHQMQADWASVGRNTSAIRTMYISPLADDVVKHAQFLVSASSRMRRHIQGALGSSAALKWCYRLVRSSPDFENLKVRVTRQLGAKKRH
jgi:hypothetical protein